MLSRSTVGRAGCWLVLVNALAWSATVNVNAYAEDETRGMPQIVAEKFAKLDLDNNKKLSLEEFQATASKDQAAIAKRDFKLFDLDADGFLSKDEFATLPTVVPAEHRGKLPDPMLELLAKSVAAMDGSFDNWDQKPDVQIDASQFIAAFSRTFSGGARPTVAEADLDGSRTVSRDEARHFLEVQLGIRRIDGKLLREPSGRVNNFMLFQYIDLNRNGVLERSEFLERSFAGAKAAEEFDKANTDGGDGLSFTEWCLIPHRAWTDPVDEFRQLDTNLDGLVDLHELMAGTPDWKKKLAASVFPGFDDDGDRALSLAEYRMTMQANMVVPWHNPITDPDGDGGLTFAEFKLDQFEFPLLRWVNFQKLDVNHDGVLDTTEFSFTTKTQDEFFVMNSDGTGWRSLFQFKGYPACGSPAVSPDGKWIAFDAWPVKQQGSSSVFVMSIDGGNPRQIESGMMPTWSKDGRSLTCSRGAPQYGVWIMQVEGDLHKHVCPGWGAQWSPDGKKIAFTDGTALKSYDVETTETVTHLDGPFNQIYWNMTWSPDSRRLCFKGTTPEGMLQVATVKMTGTAPELKVHHSGKLHLNADFAWHPQGDRIIFAMTCTERSHVQLYEFNPDKNDPPQLVPGQDKTRNNTDACWTPDGKRLIVVSGDY